MGLRQTNFSPSQLRVHLTLGLLPECLVWVSSGFPGFLPTPQNMIVDRLITLHCPLGWMNVCKMDWFSHPWWIVFTHPVFLGEVWIPSGYPKNLSRVKDSVKMRSMQYLPPAIRKPVEMSAKQSDIKTMHLIKQDFFPITSYSIMILQNRSRMINPRLFFAALLWPTTTGCVSQNSFTFVQYLLLNTIFVLPLLHIEALVYKFQVSPSYDVISVSKNQHSILKQDLFQYSWNPLAKIINHTGWMKNSKMRSRKNMWF